MIRTIFITIILLTTSFVRSQSVLSQFLKLSQPEKCWTAFHPFVAKRAFKKTQQAALITDSIKKSASIGNDNLGGKFDAFKHAYWIASVAVSIGTKKALKLGKAHEKGNKLQFKRHQLEDQQLPDSVSSAMDLYNNQQGAAAVRNQGCLSTNQVRDKIMALLKNGQLRCIKKDEAGNYLSCEGEIIDLKLWQGKWGIPKCLITSDAQSNHVK